MSRGVVVTEWVGDLAQLRVSDLPAAAAPAVGRDDVVVRVVSCGVNFFDGLMVRGRYQLKPRRPFVAGSELAGVVTQCGDGEAARRLAGRRVFATVPHGAFATEAVVPARVCREMPEGMSFDEAAAFGMVYCTAYCALVDRARLAPGETVLVHAAAGGVGLAAVQIAKALGATVIGTAGSPAKRAVAREAGADHVLDYRDRSWVKKVRDATGGRGADVVYDPVGGDVFDLSTRAVAWGGRILVVGFAGGRIPEIKLNRVLLKSISVVGVFFGSHPESDVRRYLDELVALYERGLVRPVIYRRFLLDNVADAIRAIESRKSYGKVVLRTAQSGSKL